MITAQRILTELGNKAWSGFNADDMIFKSEDSIQARTELNGALRYLINLVDFPFKMSEQAINASKGNANYKTPTGQITAVYNKDTKENLTFIGNPKSYDLTATGKPTHYWIDYKTPETKIRLYPIPDDNYKFGVQFNHFEPVVDGEDGTLKFEFEKADDYIYIPLMEDDRQRFTLEWLFMDCLVLKTMEQNNKDQEDENYQPTINEFNERWKVFKKAANPVKTTTRVVWNV